jgi:acetyl esterase/lipase
MPAVRALAPPALALGAALLLGACTKLAALDAVMPYDAGSRQVAEGVAYGAHPRQRLDVYAPGDLDSDAGAPVVVFFYGGSWNSGRRQDYAFVGHALASRGVVAVLPDYRLVPEVSYPAFLADSAAAVRWAAAHAGRYGGDAERIGVAGHSAGAYNAVMLATDPRWAELPIDAAAGLAGPYAFLPLDTRVTRRTFGSAEDLQATQPVNLVTGAGPPLFLAHGAQDGTVHPEDSALMAEAARTAGRSVTHVVYREVGHVMLLLSLGRWFRDQSDVLDDMTGFFREALGAETAAGVNPGR